MGWEWLWGLGDSLDYYTGLDPQVAPSRREVTRRYPYKDQVHGAPHSPHDKGQGPGWWDFAAPGPRPRQSWWSGRPREREPKARGPAPVSEATWAFPDLDIPFATGEEASDLGSHPHLGSASPSGRSTASWLGVSGPWVCGMGPRDKVFLSL